ncbi:RteC domain-containing protein [Mucilaginibacter sp. SMC90]|uniref:RteC domain-containing protein n=1 Tax=Mucilaginibacter sp. SMC90 TaxID=2929803 RepID=UPI001FB1CE39|nr:RteC domain-containing protein [Mucilaginibacter sp. SMC90]UOE47842.1 RteC domain-containing protein [Mucilaginibacter sp. SMC90]
MEKIKLIEEKLVSSLNALNFEADITLKLLNAALAVISSTVEDLRAVIAISHPSGEEEVEFFKVIKPRVLAYQFFYTALFKLESGKPVGPPELIREYYHKKLLQGAAYFNEHRFYYDYYRFGSNDLDQYLFIRGASLPLIPFAELGPPDKSFSTLLDYTFARFISIEMLSDYISEKLGYSDNQKLFNSNVHSEKKQRKMRWTGETVNLVEIAYGIWLTGQINNGSATITDIFYWLEDNLQVSIGKPHRRWLDISKRKRISPTRFINQMEAEINNRIEKEIAG